MDYLRYAECFYSLGKTLSFTKASLDLGIAQPAISRQIRRLEEILGVRLFIRTKHRVSFTREGRDFYQKMAPLLDRMNSDVEVLKGGNELEGTINIGTLAGIGEEFLLPITLKFKKNYPLIHLNIFYLKNDEISNDLLSGEIDFAFFSEFVDLEMVRTYKVFTEKCYMVTNGQNHHEFDPLHSNFISYKSNDPLLISYMKKYYPAINKDSSDSVFTVNSISALVKTLSKFDYYSVLAEHIIKKGIKRNKLKKVNPKCYISSDIYFSYLDQEFMPKRQVHFKDFFLSEIKNIAPR